MSLDPFAFSSQSQAASRVDIFASRMNVSTTDWSDNHGPFRGEPREPAAEQPGSFLGSVLAHVGECWRVLASVASVASVSSAGPADPKPLAPKADRTFQVNNIWQKVL